MDTIDKTELEALVNLVTEASMIEIDGEIDKSVAADKEAKSQFYPPVEDEEEQILWQGKPFLSISEHYVITNERISCQINLFNSSVS